jgi:hypothetical protein
MKRCALALAATAVLGATATGCGVDIQDAPVPVEDTPAQQPPHTPSVDTRPQATPTAPSISPILAR